MNLRQIINITLDTLELPRGQRNLDNNFRNSINEAYSIFSKVDPSIITSYIPIINGIAKLPSNALEILSCVPELNDTDKIVGKNIITDKTGLFTVIHSYIENPLTEDTDEPIIAECYHPALVDYAVYKYLSIKNPNLAQSYFSEFNNVLTEYKDASSKFKLGYDAITDVYQEFNLGSEY